MIPLSLLRLIPALLCITALIALPDFLLKQAGVSREAIEVLLGLSGGLMVFLLAYFGGYVLLFCAKHRVSDPECLQKIHDALSGIWAAGEQVALRVTLVKSHHFIAITVREGRAHRVFLSTRVVDALSSGALRGVLAHEYGHVRSGHPFRLAVLLGLVAAVKLGFGVPLPTVLCVFLAYLYMLRQWEYQADATAVELTSRSDVRSAFVEYRQVMEEKDMPRWYEFLCAHPSTHRRLLAIERIVSHDDLAGK